MFGSRVGFSGSGGSTGPGGGGGGEGLGWGAGGGGATFLHHGALATHPDTIPFRALPSFMDVSVVQ
jgi:hypothetical protein